MSLRKITYDVGVMLGAFRAPYNVASVIKNITTQFILEEFGVVVSVINPNDYGMVSERLESMFPGYRKFFIATNDNLSERRYELLWELMRSGYIRWLRYTYPAQFPQLIDADGLGERILNERLRIWANKPKYRYFIIDCAKARELGFHRMLGYDPSFFDYMPENTK